MGVLATYSPPQEWGGHFVGERSGGVTEDRKRVVTKELVSEAGSTNSLNQEEIVLRMSVRG